MTPDRRETALRSALGLCDYLARHWPEVGSLPSVTETRQEIADALAAQKREECHVISEECQKTTDLCRRLDSLMTRLESATNMVVY